MAKKLNRIASIANPHRGKRKASKGRKRNPHSAWRGGKNGPHKHKRRGYRGSKSSKRVANPSKGRKRNPSKHRKVARRRNPAFDFAGLPILDVAVGAGIAIALHALIEAVPQLSTITSDKTYGKFVAPVIVAGAGYAAYHYGKGQVKEIGKYACAFGVFLAIDAAIKEGVAKGVQSLLHGRSTAAPTTGKGTWYQGGQARVGGMWATPKLAGQTHGQYMAFNQTSGNYQPLAASNVVPKVKLF